MTETTLEDLDRQLWQISRKQVAAARLYRRLWESLRECDDEIASLDRKAHNIRLKMLPLQDAATNYLYWLDRANGRDLFIYYAPGGDDVRIFSNDWIDHNADRFTRDEDIAALLHAMPTPIPSDEIVAAIVAACMKDERLS